MNRKKYQESEQLVYYASFNHGIEYYQLRVVFTWNKTDRRYNVNQAYHCNSTNCLQDIPFRLTKKLKEEILEVLEINTVNIF